MARTFTLTFDPDSFKLPSSAHPDRGFVQNASYLAFDDTTQETAYTPRFEWPAEYAAGTVKCKLQCMMASATTNTVDVEVAVEAITPGDAVDLDSASSFDAVNSATSAAVPATAGYEFEITVTLANKDSVAAGDLVRLSVARDADDGTNDTATGDLRILAVSLYEET